ncbi:iron-containing alcohol dehydrogenase [Actinotalea sp. M2MS4P-6]|uniref:iron-containing alcohol dehydrogenase n=1 Tax=Actinotalea sp. M2MS4P-6 TaxID=2983762 RepID=UPI0021E3D259|nr:iron-containing alcohol dehydrogenase [Actinotalea sp. M2MS4P-6]MCV2396507.1 iron-containing alcohol dehydrogenase [Actinotalea sp. M2MS4P-6]
MFTFSTASRIVVGAGTAQQVPGLVERLGERVLVVHGHHSDPGTGPLAELASPTLVPWTGEPTVEGLQHAVESARAARPDVVVAWGGGSVIDLAKSIAVLLASGHDVLDHLEVIGAGVPLPTTSVPVVAVPTTAGTGAEVTANAPILSPEHGVKASLRSPAMLPALALVDPELTLTCPPGVTASAGLDALTQCLEPLTSIKANPITDALAREGLGRASRGLRHAFADGGDLAARTDMSLAALLSGMALANSKLGAVHGLAAPLGGATGAAHGALCAAVLATTTEVNVRALEEREPDSPALARYLEAARIMTGQRSASVADGVAWIRETVELLGVPGLASLGLDPDEHERTADAALAASSMAGNPIRLTRDEVLEILERSS